MVDIKALVNDEDFTNCIEDAAPHRIKIITEITPDMNNVKSEFISLMIDANWRNGKKIAEDYRNAKKNKSDDVAVLKELYLKWRKECMAIFRVVLKCIHPNENQTPTISMLYKAGAFLTYIGRDDIVLNNPNYDAETPLKFKPLEDISTEFTKLEIKNKLIGIFFEADELQTLMCENADMIKKHYYNRLPVELIFDAKDNKKGIKPSHFRQLVQHEAFKLLKDPEKYKKYIDTQLENADATVYRENIVKTKTETF